MLRIILTELEQQLGEFLMTIEDVDPDLHLPSSPLKEEFWKGRDAKRIIKNLFSEFLEMDL